MSNNETKNKSISNETKNETTLGNKIKVYENIFISKPKPYTDKDGNVHIRIC